MKNLIKLTLFLFAFISYSQINNKQVKLFQEKLILQTNSNFYLVGENIYYKINTLNNINNHYSDFSKIAYIELVNKNNISIFKQKLNLKNGISINDCFIPTNIESGNYKLIAYTKWSLNYNHFYEKDILIINPYTKFTEEINNQKSEAISNKEIKKSETNCFNLTKKYFTKREKIELNLNQKLKGSFVLNVSKIDSLPLLNNSNIKNDLNITLDNLNSNSILYFAENRGEIYTGQIQSKNNSSIENKKITFTQLGDNFDLRLSTTNKKGEFTILTNKTFNQEGYLQVFDNEKENYQLSLNKFSITNALKDLKFSNTQINPSYYNSILKRSIANQIQNIYYHFKSDTTFTAQKNKPFYFGADKQYILADYKPQNSLKEVFIEIIPEVYITKLNGKSIARVNDYEVNKSNLFEKTLFLIDGFPLQEIDEILTFDPNYFEKINFVNRGYFYNKHIFDGIVNLTTKNLNYIPKITGDWIIKTSLEKPELEKKYFKVEYTELNKEKYKKIPDYRYQLIWEPNITDLSNNSNLYFYTSDISGQFKIIIEGITESGDPVYLEDYFLVE